MVDDRYNPLLYGCRSVEHYERIGMIAQVRFLLFCGGVGRGGGLGMDGMDFVCAVVPRLSVASNR